MGHSRLAPEGCADAGAEPRCPLPTSPVAPGRGATIWPGGHGTTARFGSHISTARFGGHGTTARLSGQITTARAGGHSPTAWAGTRTRAPPRCPNTS
jgi:hypothetical protein